MDFWAMYRMLIFSGTSSTYIRKFQYQRADVVLKIHTSTKHIHYAYWWGQTVILSKRNVLSLKKKHIKISLHYQYITVETKFSGGRK